MGIFYLPLASYFLIFLNFSGSLIARDLGNIVKKEDVTESSNLTTLFVVVNK